MKTALCLLAAAALFSLPPTDARADDWLVDFASCTPTVYDSVRLGPDNTTSTNPMTWASTFDPYGTLIISGPDDDANGIGLDRTKSFPGLVYKPRQVSYMGYVTDFYPGLFYYSLGNWHFHYVLSDSYTRSGLISAPN